MELIKLPKDKFPVNGGREEPTITFYSTGKIVLNKAAVSHLRLRLDVPFKDREEPSPLKGVSFFEDPKRHEDISIGGDISGWDVRDYSGGRAVFNNRAFARHVIEKTFNAHTRCAGDTTKPPSSYSFRIAQKPIDDDDHKNIFALIRKSV